MSTTGTLSDFERSLITEAQLAQYINRGWSISNRKSECTEQNNILYDRVTLSKQQSNCIDTTLNTVAYTVCFPFVLTASIIGTIFCCAIACIATEASKTSYSQLPAHSRQFSQAVHEQSVRELRQIGNDASEASCDPLSLNCMLADQFNPCGRYRPETLKTIQKVVCVQTNYIPPSTT